jgi:hypothetical protein
VRLEASYWHVLREYAELDSLFPRRSVGNSLDLIERDGVVAPVVETGRSGRLVAAICCATSSLPPFCRYVVIPVAAGTRHASGSPHKRATPPCESPRCDVISRPPSGFALNFLPSASLAKCSATKKTLAQTPVCWLKMILSWVLSIGRF